MKVILLLILVGCSLEKDEKLIDNRIWQYYCSYETQDKRAKFTTDCIKNANPMSDEEPEDMISGCIRASQNLYCFYGNQFEAKKHYTRRKETLQEEL